MSEPVVLRIAVRELVSFVLRSGDLGAAFMSASRAVEGTRGHQFVQDQRPEEYLSEVPVRFRVDDAEPAGVDEDGRPVAPLQLDISGRVDGVLEESGRILVEEIKTTYAAFDEHRTDNAEHWAQAKIYAFILAQQRDVDEVDVQLTYVQLDTEQLREDRRTISRGELSAFFSDMVERYFRWARIWHGWCTRRDRSLHEMRFPFDEFRPGQEEMSDAVYETVSSQGRLFAQAPTGIGKTVSALFPAVRALSGEGAKLEKVFYLTAKTSGRTVAEKALDDLRGAGARIKSVTLTAKDRICFNARDGKPCDQDTCEFALGYHDRANDAIEDTFRSTDAFTRTAIEEAAQKHTVCPFELSLDLSNWSDVVVCDYNYVFDPKAFLKRYFLEGTGDYAFLIDEAHNLVDRARDMYSAQLSRTQVRRVAQALKEPVPQVAHVLDTIDAYLKTQLQRVDDEGDGRGWLDRDLPEDLMPLLQRAQAEAEPVLARNRPTPWSDELLDLFFAFVAFLRVADLYDEHYVTYGEKVGQDLRLRLYCLDPARRLGEALKRGRSASFFSATLTPVDYFRRLLGGERTDYTVELPSPFPSENLAVLVDDGIDTTYRGRAHSYDDVAAAISAAVRHRRGNYIVYFPSYKYLQEVVGRFEMVAPPSTMIMVQVPRMSERQKEQFLDVFRVNNPDTVVGFAVMGGIFGEGIDLVGERLVGAVVVGVGLPQICLERDLIKGYYDEHEAAGFAYAYTYPGMNRVLQAAGRVIRTEKDRGLILLIDRRFGREEYRALFPPWWKGTVVTRTPAAIEEAAALFWGT
ncbi:MAG: ATP-dependent DNA helicase [Candidatus Latescibacterota bacterium]|nr:ATP-dependent DNA helicase [Candidatus Latescibacterota bacterium]